MLAHWAGWGAVPQVFDPDDDRFATERDQLSGFLDGKAWDAARRTTLNAHYTSAEVVQAMWRAVEVLGFQRGHVVEPGCGSGNFLGFAPAGADLVGVELDPTTAAIAQHLYGARATIRQTAFEDLRDEDGSFDLAIGNVPYADVTPYDPVHNKGGHSLHNYFLLRSLHLVRPGGFVVALTSRYTMDSQNTAARQEMAELADLVGAIRLPERAFAASSGTDVVVDLVLLRRRKPGVVPNSTAWMNTVPADVASTAQGAEGDDPLPINEYYAQRHGLVLGQLTAARGMYRARELTVTATGDLKPQLDDAMSYIYRVAGFAGLVFTNPTPEPSALRPTDQTRSDHPDTWNVRYAQEGSFVVASDGQRIGRYVNGQVQRYSPRVRKDEAELRRLIRLRDSTRELLELQRTGAPDDKIATAQQDLADAHDHYVRYYRALNRFRLVRTGAVDPDTGEPVMRRDYPRMGGFRRDPDWPLVSALEVFDDESQMAQRAPIFTERVVSRPAERQRAESPADALAVSLDERGTVSVERIAELLGVDEVEARRQVADLVYETPVTGELVPGARYLSGNVRDKLRQAETALERDGDRWRTNVEALRRAMPTQLEPGGITVHLGAPWIDADDIETFCSEVLRSTVQVEHLPSIGRWAVKATGYRRSVTLTSEWGTSRADGTVLLDAALNQRLHTVYDTVKTPSGGERRVRNDEQTLAAREKQEALDGRFGEWVWEDAGRAQRITDRYNELFRSDVLTHHDGSHLTLPGLAANFVPKQHQRDAVARILNDGRALLAHAVGAGKTAVMVTAAMELRRLGSAAKPAVVVPNHMLEQFSREWLQLYPDAKVLIADSGQLDKANRKAFVARCATGDWDGVVFTQNGFGQIPLGRELRAEYLGRELRAAREALAASKEGKKLTVKRLERSIARLQETYQKLLNARGKDDGVRFEETGIDYVFVDEAHAYKNRRIVTDIDDVAHQGSRRAQDLDAKLWALRREHGVRCATFATATPVANSVAELWVMQSYLQHDLLAERHMTVFNAWAATFGKTHTALELAPDGASYRMKTRFARFQNVPELLDLYHQVADVRSKQDLALPEPDIKDGQAEVVVVPGSDDLRDYVQHLARRAEMVRAMAIPPDQDNMLKITGDGRRAALDLRLVSRRPDPAGGKIAAAAKRIAATHHATRERTYLDPLGEPAARPGALQLVFCDVSTPASKGWHAYDELRDQLVRRGVPAEAIRYMQEAKSHAAKADLFAACRDGRIAVLVGSTETMGVGTNVQARAVALHHLDAPWRPADIEQREGRILRQGCQNPTVEIIRYVTEGSFDIYMWQTLERKAAFIEQVSRGDTTEREIEDVGDQTLSFAEVKALATGDPRIMEKAQVDSDVSRLTRLEHAWHADQKLLGETAERARERAAKATATADAIADAVDDLTDTTGDKFTMTVEQAVHRKRADAGQHLKTLLARRLRATPPNESSDPEPIAQLAGLTIEARTTKIIDDEILLEIPVGDIQIRYLADEWKDTDPTKIVQRLEHQIRKLPAMLETLRTDAHDALDEADRADSRIGQPWEHASDLYRLRHRQRELNDQLTGSSDSRPPTPDADGNRALVNAATNDLLGMAGFPRSSSGGGISL